jgi:phosphoribosylaminoimidazole-succinocarboxamide synthase
MTPTPTSPRISSLEHLASGKVRDIYRIDDKHLLFVASDRLSAFDVVMSDPIPGKGHILTEVSKFWFENTTHIISNHYRGTDISDLPVTETERAWLDGRSMIVRKSRVLPVEAIVRGYLAGSGWKEYQSQGSICGIELPAGLRLADKLPNTLFTPSTKAEAGQHDVNVSYALLVDIIGEPYATQLQEASLALYNYAANYALERGIIIADTKFEFGLDDDGKLVLIDEALTPDSSRFWPLDSYQPGSSPVSFDKQFVRDWLEKTGWNKQPPPPRIPEEIILQTRDKFFVALQRLTGPA